MFCSYRTQTGPLLMGIVTAETLEGGEAQGHTLPRTS